jgi:hypothetical protein
MFWKKRQGEKKAQTSVNNHALRLHLTHTSRSASSPQPYFKVLRRSVIVNGGDTLLENDQGIADEQVGNVPSQALIHTWAHMIQTQDQEHSQSSTHEEAFPTNHGQLTRFMKTCVPPSTRVAKAPSSTTRGRSLYLSWKHTREGKVEPT